MAEAYVDSTPYKWPFNGDLTPQNTCIIVIVSAPPPRVLADHNNIIISTETNKTFGPRFPPT